MGKLSMVEVFVDCQKGLHSHGKLVKRLGKIYKSLSLEEFWEQFLHNLKHSLIVYKREQAVERTIEFVSRFSTCVAERDGEKTEKEKVNELIEDEEEEDMSVFLSKLFDFLLKNHNACNKAVRYRCCQLINKLLQNMGDEAQIDDELYDRIYECMLQRLRDKFPIVRVHAVFALGRLQDPTDLDCPIINAYMFLLNCDANSDVRRAVLSCIAASTKTLPCILERARDTNDNVRKLAFQILAEKVHIKALTIAQREQLLQDGLNDRSESVKDACSSKLLQAWLRMFEGRIVEMLQCLDVESCLELAEKTVLCMLKKVPANELVPSMDLLNEQLVLPVAELTCESVLYWRCLAEHIKGMGNEGDELLDKIVPNATAMAKYINEVFEIMQVEDDVEGELRNEFIMQQLMIIAGVLDLSDEVGRKHIDRLMKELLISDKVGHRLVKQLLKHFVELYKDSKTRINILVEIISDIREPITAVQTPKTKERQRQIEVKIAGIRVELNQMRERLDDAIQTQDFAAAAEIKDKVTELENKKDELITESTMASHEVRQEKNDPATLLKCLTIAADMMETANLETMIPSLLTLIDVLILPGITHQDPAVRNQAVRSLGLCCLVSQDMAKAHLLLFVQVSQMDQATVKMTALNVIFDLLLMYGPEAFNVDTQQDDEDEQGNSDTDGGKQASSDDSDSDFEESVERRRQKKQQKPKKEDMPKEPLSTAGSLLNILTGLLDSETSEVRTVAAEGLAKLLLSGQVVSHKLLSRLLLLWYNPITEDDTNLRHCLGAFFPVYAFASRSNQEVMEEAFLPTLRTLFNAPPSSPLSEVNVNNVADLMVQLTNARHLVSQVASQIEKVKDKQCLRTVEKFKAVVKDMLKETALDTTEAPSQLLDDTAATDRTQSAGTENTTDREMETEGDTADEDANKPDESESGEKKVKDKQCLRTVEKFKAVVKDMLKETALDTTEAPSQLLDDTAATDRTQSAGTENTTDREMETEGDTADEDANKPDESESGEKETDAASEKAVSELSDKTNQMDLDDSSQTSGEQQVEKPKRRGKRTKKESNFTDSEPEVTKKRSTRGAEAKISTPPASRRVVKLINEDGTNESSGSDFENEDVFASPTPVRRITRGRRGKQSTAKAEDESMKKSLSKELDMDVQEEKTRSTSTRSTRTRSGRKK